MGTTGGNSLDDLLRGVPGFAKPSLKDLRQQQQQPGTAPGTRSQNAGPGANGSPLRPQGAGLGMDRVNSSPSLAQQRGSASSASGSSLAGLGGSRPAVGAPAPTPPVGGGGAFDDLLGGLGPSMRGGSSMRVQPPAAVQAQAPQAAPAQPPAAVPQPPPTQAPLAAAPPAPLFSVPDLGGPPPVVDEDPFALFGGPPPSGPASGSGSRAGSVAGTAHVPIATVDDGFLDAFAAPAPVPPLATHTQPARVPTRAAAVAASAAAPEQHHDFGDFLGSPDQEVQLPAAAASPPQAPAVPAAAAASPTSSFGYERRPGSGAGSQPRYRVFDFVEPEPRSQSPAKAGAAAATTGAAAAAAAGAAGAAGASSRPGSRGPLENGMQGSGASSGGRGAVPPRAPQPAARPGPGGGALHADSYGQPPQGTKEVVSELSQKAAKALHSGTKWFMKASKTLVSQVQQRLEHGQGGAHPDAGGAAAAARRPGDPAPFHYDWAGQLSRVSPGSRAAALGAMAEEDRLAVQRVLDESVLGDSYMESPEYDGFAEPSSRQQQGAAAQQHEGSTHGSEGGRPASAAAEGGRASRSSSRSSLAAPAPAPPPPAYGDLFEGRAPSPDTRQQPAGTAAAAAGSIATAQPAAAAQDDLLGVAEPAARPPASAAPAAAPADADFLFGDSEPAAAAGGAGAASSTAHIDDLFTVPASRPSASGSGRAGGGSAPPRPPARPAAAASSSSSRPASGLDSMIDLGGELPCVDTAGFGALYQDAEDDVGGDADEPELRRALRQKRIQEKHERMMRQLAEKRARDEVEAAEKSGKVELRTTLKPKIDGWAAGKKDNIRALLATLHTVLWEGSGWVQPNMSDMVDNSKVKRVYMKANLVVHPDKVKQKGGTLEQVATADMVFDVLKAAWGKFEA